MEVMRQSWTHRKCPLNTSYYCFHLILAALPPPLALPQALSHFLPEKQLGPPQ